MADLRNQRRMASTLLKCGANRVWLDHDRIDEIAKAVTKDDIRVLIRGKAIKSKQEKGTSRGRKNLMQNKRKRDVDVDMDQEKGQSMHVCPEKSDGYAQYDQLDLI